MYMIDQLVVHTEPDQGYFRYEIVCSWYRYQLSPDNYN